MKKSILIIVSLAFLAQASPRAEEAAAAKGVEAASDPGCQEYRIEVLGETGKRIIYVKKLPEASADFEGEGMWFPLFAGYRHNETQSKWFVFPLLMSGSSNKGSGYSDFFSLFYAGARKGFNLKVDDSNRDEVIMDAVIDDKAENDNAAATLRSMPVLFTFWGGVETEKEKISVFTTLPLLTMTASTSDSLVLASVPLLSFYQSGRNTEYCSTLFGLLFDYRKDLKTTETSLLKGIIYSSDFDGVMDKRKIGPFGLLYSSTVKEDQSRYSSMWDFIFKYSSSKTGEDFDVGPFGLFYSSSDACGELDTSILYSLLYQSTRSADGSIRTWSFTPLFGIRSEKGETGFSILSIELF